MSAAMPMPNDDDDNIYRVETVPPPPGESDAYNAPTKLGPMPLATLAAMKRASETGTALKPVALPHLGAAPPQQAEKRQVDGEITRIRHDEDDEPDRGEGETRLVGPRGGAVAEAVEAEPELPSAPQRLAEPAAPPVPERVQMIATPPSPAPGTMRIRTVFVFAFAAAFAVLAVLALSAIRMFWLR